MRPPESMNVIDSHGGFTAETHGKNIGTCTLWRPGRVLKHGTIGTLISGSVNEHSFFQINDDVTRAAYKVKGYRYPVIVWFDNKTGERIA